MRYRKLGANNEPYMGRGKQDYISDAEAVGQAVITRLKLFRGEWWDDETIGIPLWQTMLGIVGTKKASIDRILQDTILATQGVRRIIEMDSRFNSETRGYDFYCAIDTIYGITVITNQGEIQR